jgi:hypothetical protein
VNPFVASLHRGLAVLAAVTLLTTLAPAHVHAATPKPAAAAKTAKAPKVKKAKAPEKPYAEQKAENGVYTRGTNWLSARFGWSKRAGEINGDGLVGYGLQYQHMMNNRDAFAVGVDRDIVGHFGRQIDQAVPFTAEFQRHYRWKTAVRPFVGVGGGYYFRKYYRTGTDYGTFTTGGAHVSLGFTSALDDRHILGVQARVARIKGRGDTVVNPTFGAGSDTELLWTIKATLSLAY